MKKKTGEKLQEIEDFLKSNKISGIFLIPKFGLFSMFKSTSDKLLILEHAKVEVATREALIQKEAIDKADMAIDFSYYNGEDGDVVVENEPKNKQKYIG